MTHNKIVARKLVDELSRNLYRQGKEFDNYNTCQSLLTILQEELHNTLPLTKN